MRRVLLVILLVAAFAGGYHLGRRTESVDGDEALRTAGQRTRQGWHDAVDAGRSIFTRHDDRGNAE
ncbi:MAG: hypothetical protein KGY99_04520 [Phycisphaerae bacterium]|nr:hypothetical protein [Phycisphaerae bacterium]